MRRLLVLALIALLVQLVVACAGAAPTAPRNHDAPRVASTVELADDVHVHQLADGVWRHVSFKDLPGVGPFPSNGLIVLGAEGALLVDTPWTPEQTRLLLGWIEKTWRTQVREVVITHAHDDRLGGIAEIGSAARIHALPATSEQAARRGWVFPAVPLAADASLELVGERVATFFPGAGHTSDNIVVWFPARGLLFGGCFVKSARAPDLGNVADADIASWRTSIQRVIERYPAARTVVPGHGDPGGLELLIHTRDLIDAALAKASASSNGSRSDSAPAAPGLRR